MLTHFQAKKDIYYSFLSLYMKWKETDDLSRGIMLPIELTLRQQAPHLNKPFVVPAKSFLRRAGWSLLLALRRKTTTL